MKAPKALHIVNKYWVPQKEAEKFIPRMHFKKAQVDEYIKQYSYTTPSGKVYVDKAIRHRNQYMQNFVSFVRRTGDAAKELDQICRFYDFFIVNSTSVQDLCRFIGRVSDDDQEGSFVNAIQVAKMYDAAILVTSFRNIPFSIRSAVQGHAIDFKAMSLARNERGLGIVWASEFYKYD